MKYHVNDVFYIQDFGIFFIQEIKKACVLDRHYHMLELSLDYQRELDFNEQELYIQSKLPKETGDYLINDYFTKRAKILLL